LLCLCSHGRLVGADCEHAKWERLKVDALTPLSLPCSFQVESIRALAAKGSEVAHFSVPAVIAASIGFAVKLLLAVYCYHFREASSQLEMLYEDNRNDCFEYGFAIFTSAAGAKLAWWVDPAGAMAIALMIIFTWTMTVKQELLQLCGQGAPPAFIREVTFAAIQHSADFLQIDSVSAYHWGEKYMVEVDVIMAPENGLTRAHDLSQSLQDKLERFEMVARAYVHVDYGELGVAVPFSQLMHADCIFYVDTDSVHAPEHRKNR
jgi:divalent metal cation (Fe/Co/Zn/Cd) transporter